MDSKTLDFNPERAHIEGTFYYYVVAAVCAIYKIINWGITQLGISTGSFSINQTESLILVGRLITICFGTLGIYLMYIVIRQAKLSKASALLAALVVAIYPIGVTYSHYMRPHTLANTLFITSLLVLFTTTIKSKTVRIALVGLLMGLATATRYNMAIILVIPGMFLLIESIESKVSVLQIVFNKYFAILVAFFVCGLFLGDPFLFISFNEMRPYLEYQRTFSEPGAFALNNLTNIEYPIKYITYLIPESGKPFLAIGVYISILLAFINKKRLKLALPLVAYFLIYTYLMGKGYAQPIFPRAIIPLIPAFALFVSIAHNNIADLPIHPKLKLLFPTAIIALCACSFYYLTNIYFLN